MRGRTFHNTFIIADEMQNSSPMQMLMLTTRIGMNSKMVVMGDLQQSDRKDKQNGLTDFLEKYRQYYPDSVYENKSNHLISIVELDSKDILRSPVVSYLLDIYNHKESKKLEQFKESKKLEKIQDLSMMDCALISKKDMEKLNKN
jgi:phosphate starvation-inducible PhoH-like protein